MPEQTWSTVRRWDRCGALVGTITHGGPNQFCIQERPCPDHEKLKYWRKRAEDAEAELKRLKKSEHA